MALGHEGAGIAEVDTPIFLVFSILSTRLMRIEDLKWDHRIMIQTFFIFSSLVWSELEILLLHSTLSTITNKSIGSRICCQDHQKG